MLAPPFCAPAQLRAWRDARCGCRLRSRTGLQVRCKQLLVPVCVWLGWAGHAGLPSSLTALHLGWQRRSAVLQACRRFIDGMACLRRSLPVHRLPVMQSACFSCLPGCCTQAACSSTAERRCLAADFQAACFCCSWQLCLAGTPRATDHTCSSLQKTALWSPAGKIYAKARALFVAPSSQRLAKDVFNYLKDGMVIKAPAAGASRITTGSM